jgi:membrane-bound metal-dependent hydrolase YbcI (DUF457 family)
MKEQPMYAVGHLALGYLSGKTASKILGVKINIPLLFLASVLPDIDLLVPGLEHRGPMHSVIVFCLLFIPIFILFKKRAIPYFLALTQHSLIGDYLTGETQILWPVTTNWYGLGMEITSLTNILIEWALFLTSTAILFKTKDAWLLLQRHPSNMILAIPVLTVLLPTLLSFPLYVSLELVIPHLSYLALFAFSILVDLRTIFTKI